MRFQIPSDFLIPARAENRRYFSEKQAAEYLGFSQSQLSKLRTTSAIPAIIHSPRCIRYDVSDLDAYMALRKRGGTGDPSDAAKGAVDSKMCNQRRSERRNVRTEVAK